MRIVGECMKGPVLSGVFQDACFRTVYFGYPSFRQSVTPPETTIQMSHEWNSAIMRHYLGSMHGTIPMLIPRKWEALSPLSSRMIVM